jgi:hypothetical protein
VSLACLSYYLVVSFELVLSQLSYLLRKLRTALSNVRLQGVYSYLSLNNGRCGDLPHPMML